ncbi:MAG: ADP-ribosylation factor-like protein, partial [Candidatus Hodarchaeota archaeon]
IRVSTIDDLVRIPSNLISRELQISIKLIEKFCLSARIIAHYVKHGDEEKLRRKIVLAGLNSAGKTSIIHSIQNMETVAYLRPTLGVKVDQFDLVGKNITIWDLGGQSAFRDVFTRPNSVQFSGLSLLIFVFDVQARGRALEGLEYFTRTMKVANFLHQKPKLVIFFHKYDHTRGQSLVRVFEANKRHLLMRLQPLIRRYKLSQVEYYDTSIYDIPGLIQAFSKALTSISPVASILSDTLEFYSKEQKALGTFLMSDKGLVIAEYLGKLNKKSRDDALIQAMITIRDNPNRQLFSERVGVNLFVTIKQLLINDVKMFLISVNDRDTELENSDSHNLHEILSPWIANLFATF